MGSKSMGLHPAAVCAAEAPLLIQGIPSSPLVFLGDLVVEYSLEPVDEKQEDETKTVDSNRKQNVR